MWSAEANGADAFTPLALAAVWAPTLRLGTAIVPAYTRGPGTLAQCVGSLAEAAPGPVRARHRHVVDVIVERWNGIPFEQPYQRTRDTVRFLRAALTGEKVTEDYETFSVKGFRLGVVPPSSRPILVAALREGMLRLAGREGDGAIINWLSADDVKPVAPMVRQFGPTPTAPTRRSSPASSWRPARTPTPCGPWAASPSPPTSTCPCTPRSTTGSAAGDQLADMWTAVEGGRPQGRHRRHPRRGRRRS